MWLTEFHTSRG